MLDPLQARKTDIFRSFSAPPNAGRPIVKPSAAAADTLPRVRRGALSLPCPVGVEGLPVDDHADQIPEYAVLVFLCLAVENLDAGRNFSRLAIRQTKPERLVRFFEVAAARVRAPPLAVRLIQKILYRVLEKLGVLPERTSTVPCGQHSPMIFAIVESAPAPSIPRRMIWKCARTLHPGSSCSAGNTM